MIVEWLVQIFCGLVGWIGTLLPDGEVPGWVHDWSSNLGTVAGEISSVGVWIPLQLMVTVATAVVGCVVLGFSIRLLRIVASFFTAGGGAAG